MNSFIGWIGGKRLLRKDILKEFPPAGTYRRYIEVFGGAGWVLFSKEKHAELEVYNDINSQLVNLFRCVKYHLAALQQELQWLLNSREMFLTARDMQQEGFTDLQRAARFWIIIKESYGSDCHSFGLKGKNLLNNIAYLEKVAQRLNSVVIENLDFQHLIKTYDRVDALFYLDPPYYNAEEYYPGTFCTEDHARLKHCLDKVKGKFILSYNDCPEIRKLYQSYKMIEVTRQNNLVAESGRDYKELLIKNF